MQHRGVRASFVLLCVLLCGGLPPVGWARDTAPAPQVGGVYRRPLANNPSTLDPARIADNYAITVAQQLFDGLVQYSAALGIIPALAQSWEASRDGLTWTFRLRKGARFHHGREVVVDDVIFSFTRILDPRLRSRAADLFLNVRGARDFVEGKAKAVRGFRALDRHTLRVELTEASAPFVAGLAVGHTKIVPREVVEQLGEAFGSRPIGTGPFRFARWVQDQEIVLEANLDFYGGRPFLDRLEYRIHPGQQTERFFAGFERGDLEDSFVPASERDRVQQEGRYQFVRRAILGVRFLGFRTAAGPLANPLVRQAFSHAIDREAIVREINRNRYRAGAGFLPPGTYGFDPKFRPFPYDPERARALLARAGYPGGKGLEPVTIWSNIDSADIKREHEAIRQYLGAVGIRAELQYHTSWPEFWGMLQEGRLPIFRFGWAADLPDPDNFLTPFFHSRGTTNLTGFRSDRVDRLLDRARAEQNPLRRVELYHQAERLIFADAPLLPLSYHSYERVFQPYVRGVEISALGDPYLPMRKIWLVN